MIYLVSDLHFGHNRIYVVNSRGFKTIEEHDEAIISNWNSVVTEDDDVYILGDCMLIDSDNGYKCLSRLNGRIHLVRGNHDTDAKMKFYDKLGIDYCGYATIIKYKHYHFYLSHYPTICSNYSDSGLRNCIINLCGHTHTTDRFIDMDKGLIYHCELDAHNNKPISIDYIIEDIKKYLGII